MAELLATTLPAPRLRGQEAGLPENEQELDDSETVTESTGDLTYYSVEIDEELITPDLDPDLNQVTSDVTPLPAQAGDSIESIEKPKVEETDSDPAQDVAEDFYLFLEENFETVTGPANFDSYSQKDGEWVAVDQQTGELRTAKELLGQDYNQWIERLQAGETIIDVNQSEDGEATWVLATQLVDDKIVSTMVEIQGYVTQEEIVEIFDQDDEEPLETTPEEPYEVYWDTSEVSPEDETDLAIAEFESETIDLVEVDSEANFDEYETDFDYPQAGLASVSPPVQSEVLETPIQQDQIWPTEFFEPSPDFSIVAKGETVVIVRPVLETNPHLDTSEVSPEKPARPPTDIPDVLSASRPRLAEDESSRASGPVTTLDVTKPDRPDVKVAIAQVRAEIAEIEEPPLPEQFKEMLVIKKPLEPTNVTAESPSPSVPQQQSLRPLVEKLDLVQTRELIEAMDPPKEKEILEIVLAQTLSTKPIPEPKPDPVPQEPLAAIFEPRYGRQQLKKTEIERKTQKIPIAEQPTQQSAEIKSQKSQKVTITTRENTKAETTNPTVIDAVKSEIKNQATVTKTVTGLSTQKNQRQEIIPKETHSEPTQSIASGKIEVKKTPTNRPIEQPKTTTQSQSRVEYQATEPKNQTTTQKLEPKGNPAIKETTSTRPARIAKALRLKPNLRLNQTSTVNWLTAHADLPA